MYCTHFIENILSGIVQHIEEQCELFSTTYVIIRYHFAYF